MSLRHVPLVAAALLAALLLCAPSLDAQQVDVIRGRVTAPDSTGIEGVQVTVTSLSSNVNRTTNTGRDGRFTVTFPGGDGDYMVSFAAVGYAPRRFQVKRVADEDVLIADARLARVDMLEAVTVTAPRGRVSRNDVTRDVGGTEQTIDATPNAIPANDLGDLAAMAATLPGVQLVPGEEGGPNGYSVFGLGADQNNATLNGMYFGGSSLPRDAAVMTSLVTSPYDVSRGGFSGAQMSMRTRPGGNIRVRGSSINLDAPQMQWTDRAARSLGQEYMNASLGGLISGPIRTDRSFYSISYQLGRRASDHQSLLNTSPVGLQAAGVAPDSVNRLIGILQQAQVPTATSRFGSDRLSQQGSLLGSFDYTPPTSTSGQAFNVAVNGSWNRTNPAGGFATDFPSYGGERTGWRGGVQGRHSGYWSSILTETSAGLSVARNESSPYLGMPTGRVRVSSDLPDGGAAVQTLSFGGNPGLDSRETNTITSFMNQLSWFSTDSRHRVRATSELRHERSEQEQAVNRLGTFTFNSLANLENGLVSTFTRQLAARDRRASQLVGGLSLGDSWRRTTNLQFQYGVRIDANRFLTSPAFNPLVESELGIRNDRVPNTLALSPRLGFSWTYGTAPEVAGFVGAMRAPRAVIRGGVGVFQGTPATSTIGSALENTGLPGSVRQITCVGAAAPIPDWHAWSMDPSAVPDQCADGTAGTTFANAAPSVTLFSPDWSAPRSIRSNLQWSGPTLRNRFQMQVEATWSTNMNQSSWTDLNFQPGVGFTLAGEGGRSVFVQPGSIVPATGAIASWDSRQSGHFSRVTEMRSDLRSESRQLSFRLSPTGFRTGFNWSLGYVLGEVREQSRGFSSTGGDPRMVEWSRGSMDARHQLTYSLAYNFFDAVRVSWFGNFRSGTPFTPMIVGDVNGDGYSNDRAFIFDPGDVNDPFVATGIASLLANGSDAARRCLQRQLGRIASRNSCEGPWTSTASMSVSFNPVKIRMPQRTTLSFQLSNPLAAADLLVNGSRGVRGWGQSAVPDQALLYVRGFDPATQRYRYEVNERFGATNPALSAFRSPVSLTAMMRIDLGPTREKQLLAQQLDRGRRIEGQRAPEALLRAMYGSGGIPNPLAGILREQDTLKLTGQQADSIAMLNRWYGIRVDSIWSPVTRYLAELPDSYDGGEAYDRYLAARRATVDLLSRLASDVKGVLTIEQRRRLPTQIASYLEPRYLASIRSGTGTFTGGGGVPGLMPAGTGGMIQGGAGTRIEIIRQ